MIVVLFGLFSLFYSVLFFIFIFPGAMTVEIMRFIPEYLLILGVYRSSLKGNIANFMQTTTELVERKNVVMVK